MTTGRLIQVGSLSLAFAMVATAARAQSASHLGLGAGMNFYRPSSSDAERSQGVGAVYRWHSFHSGWGPTFGLDLRRTEFTQSLHGVDSPFGSVRMRSVLIGVGHTEHMGRFSVSASASGGYAFNHLSVDGGAGQAYDRAGLSLIGARIRNSAAGKAETSVWYDVGKRIGLGVSVAYLMARPVVISTTTAGSTAKHLRADALELQAGVTVGLWKDRHRN